MTSLGQQCFGCQGHGHVRSKCPTYLRSKGKAMDVTLSDDEEFGHESDNDQEGSFIATAIVGESEIVDENSSDGELSENANLQETYNKLCKIVAKDAMNVDLGLKKILLNMKTKIFWSICLMLMNSSMLLRLRTCLGLKRLKV